MEARTGSCKVNFREIARELGISHTTVYRVVNLDPAVRRETRARVIDALNRHGYYTHKPPKALRVLFDFTDHSYLTHYGQLLMANVEKLHFRCFATDHRQAPGQFFDLAATCDVALFASNPEPELIERLRREAPELYTVTLTTQSNADVTITPDNTRGGELAAAYFHQLGCRRVAVHLADIQPTRFERYKGFLAEMALRAPDCRIEAIRENRGESTETALRRYFAGQPALPDGLLFLAGGFAENFYETMVQPDPERFAALPVLTFDRPQDLAFERRLQHPYPYIGCAAQDLLDWAEYFITNRPMMKKRSPIHTGIRMQLFTPSNSGVIDDEF